MPEYAGSGLRAQRTYERLSKKYNIEYEVICNSIEHVSNKKYTLGGVYITRISNKIFNILSNKSDGILNRFFFVLKYYTEFLLTAWLLFIKKYDLIHTFGNSSSVASAAYLSSFLKKPVIIELVNIPIDNPHPYLPLFNRFIKPNFNTGKVFVAISREIENICHSYGYFENVWQRPNPLDKSRFFVRPLNSSKLLRKRLTQFNENDIVMSYIAKFMKRKNQLFLINVLSKLPEKYKLILAGPIVSSGKNKYKDLSYLKNIKQCIIDLGLSKRVLLIEKMVNTDDYLAISDIFLFPSYNEALGTPLLESLGCGIRVVANTNEGAFREWIIDGENGYLCDLIVEDWVKTIKSLTPYNINMKKKISEYIYKFADSEQIDKRYYEIIKSLIDSGYNNKIIIKNNFN